jgi:antitoxin (DNA-binding transcriptional repressor) of toxin-antitoxin stability system
VQLDVVAEPSAWLPALLPPQRAERHRHPILVTCDGRGFGFRSLQRRPSQGLTQFATFRLSLLRDILSRVARKLAILTTMNRTVNVAEFKDRVSELLALVEQGAEVIVCRRNVPLARVQERGRITLKHHWRAWRDTLLKRTGWPCLPVTAEVMAEAF